MFSKIKISGHFWLMTGYPSKYPYVHSLRSAHCPSTRSTILRHSPLASALTHPKIQFSKNKRTSRPPHERTRTDRTSLSPLYTYTFMNFVDIENLPLNFEIPKDVISYIQTANKFTIMPIKVILIQLGISLTDQRMDTPSQWDS